MIPPRVVLATWNPGKVAELARLVRGWGAVETLSLAAFPGVRCPEERETTYAENARAKAETVAAATGLPALADDSGLEVEALGGAPGIRSARWAPTDGERIAKLLAALAGTPAAGRRARFRCAVALAWPAGATEIAEGQCTGVIAEERAGAAGFGYDPIFVSDDLGRTFATASAEEKDRVSHRARAVRALGAHLGGATLRRAVPAC